MAFDRKTYHDQQEIKNTLKIREIVSALPKSVSTFMRGIEPSTQSRTRLAYAIDLKNFFEFLIQNNPQIAKENLRDLSNETLSEITSFDIEEYLEYLKVYVDANGRTVTNSEQAIKRKLCALRSYYKYMYQHKMVTANPATQVSVPRMHEKAIVRLDPNETAELLDHVESGDGFSKRQTNSRKKNSVRNLAIVTLLLGTGIRVSECVGLDVNDIDFNNDRIKVVRKGGSESFVYFGDEVRKALIDYLEERTTQTPVKGSENALFLSSRLSRMSVRNIEIMVKEYARETVQLKKITPHKLRSTYGTTLYKETGDIYLVADVLGHKDVNTTRKHYANLDDDRRRYARNKVTLRETEENDNGNGK